MINIIALPFRFLRWSFTNGWKGFLVLIILSILLIVGFAVVKNGIMGSGQTKPATGQIIQQDIPNKTDAPFLVSTTGRDYYAAQAVQKKGITTLTTYWDLIRGHWVKFSQTLVLGTEYGDVQVKRR